MVGKIKNNKHLINAPAGSGKTTYIRNKLKRRCHTPAHWCQVDVPQTA